MKIAYYLNEGRTKNLYCRISDESREVTFSLGHTVNPKAWNAKKEESSDSVEYRYALVDFKNHLENRYNQLKAEGREDILEILKTESTDIVDGDGIRGIARSMFDMENKAHSLPSYDEFMTAFEKFKGLKPGEYQAQTVEHVIYFTVDGTTYEVDTYEGKTAFLKSIIEDESYEEIYTMTNENIWSHIYTDARIAKHVFLPKMLLEWESYWDKQYEELSERGGPATQIDKRKELSWKQFQVYMACYDGHGDAIALAGEIDDLGLLPVAIVTMLNIFDANTCYSEYCELEFSDDQWESYSLSDDDGNDEQAIFYIRESEL